MIYSEAMEDIEVAIDLFARGNPMYFQVDVAEGVWFDFDCPFESDPEEPTISIAVGIRADSPHNEGEPEEHRLMDYSEFGDELTARLDEAFYNAGSRNEEVVFEYSARNSNNGTYLFLGAIHNPRITVTEEGVSVNEEYA